MHGDDYEGPEDQSGASEPEEFDIENPSSWAPWHEKDLSSNSLPETMQESLQDSTFTAATVDELPISVGLISKSVQDDPTALLVDSWRFAIMSGNLELLETLSRKQEGYIPAEVLQIYPFHLAASYLDGGNDCCMVFRTLLDCCTGSRLRRCNVNDTGQTILDSLLMSVLRSHTSVSPDHVSLGSSPLNRYPGEEKDICGRWDADSPEVRELFRYGYARIPTAWKHPFCHTATQATCHAIINCLGSSVGPDINTPSGLFVRRCLSCGLELKPGPLHTLVILTFYLAQNGMAGETLFGALTILVCLLRLGVSVSATANISVEEILGTTDSGRCLHTPLTPHDLMSAVPDSLVERWTEDCRVGWDCMHQTLRLGEKDEEWDEDSEDPWCELNDEGAHGEWLNLSCGDPKLGILWATIQVEFLTYRRIEEGAPWISKNFSMPSLRVWLADETEEFRTLLVERRMMKDHTHCGWFFNGIFICPTAAEVCVFFYEYGGL